MSAPEELAATSAPLSTETNESTSSSPVASTTTTVTSTITSTPSSSKLQPAPAPLVSAWGKKSGSISTSSTKAPQNGIQKEHWPSAEAALEAAATKDATKDAPVAASKPASTPAPKVKSTGKEKWVPFEATIVLPSASGNNNKKKNNNNNNNNNNSNNKKKQGQGKQQQQNKGGKDGKGKKSSPDGNNKSQSKNAGEKNADITKEIGDLTIHDKDNEKNGNGFKEGSAPLDPLEKSTGSSNVNKDTTNQQDTQASGSEVEQGNTSPQFNSASQHHQQNHNKKKFQHRNSEPANQYNNNQQYQNYNNHKGGRRYNQNNKNNFNNFRHSVAGASNYPNVPFLVNPAYNYGYMPIVAPPLNYSGVNYQAPGSRSNSASPAKDELNPFVPLNNGAGAPTAGVYPQAIGFPYVEDPLMLIVNQVNYYFSTENLVKDLYLRKQMNSQGFVPLKKLIEFNRLKTLTGGDIQQLNIALNYLPHLEVQNGKIRVSLNWSNWILPFDQRDDAGKEEEQEEGINEAEPESSPATEA